MNDWVVVVATDLVCLTRRARAYPISDVTLHAMLHKVFANQMLQGTDARMSQTMNKVKNLVSRIQWDDWSR